MKFVNDNPGFESNESDLEEIKKMGYKGWYLKNIFEDLLPKYNQAHPDSKVEDAELIERLRKFFSDECDKQSQKS